MARAVTAPHSLRNAGARARREPNGFGHAQVAQIQRARILAAMFDVVTERGVGNVSVAHVVQRSGVSRRTFYEVFGGREDCFLAAFDDALAFVSQRVLPAYAAEKTWRDRIRAGLFALLTFLDEEPVIGRLLIVESLSAGPRTLERRNHVLALVAAAVDEGRTQSATAASLPSLTAEGLVGGALALIHTRLALADHEPLLGLTNQLTSMIVLPYQGAAAARRELDRSVKPCVSEGPKARLLSDPFKGANMRLTYRTVRVLLAVAEHPSASNRLIGESAGIVDQGQISKLLARLERLGLISNSGLGPGQGAPNAWSLTSTGQQVVNSVRAHTDNSNPEGDSKR
ncbi:MAG: TetR family transcriptional regulator [Solirubrobacteraceae bacterium]